MRKNPVMLTLDTSDKKEEISFVYYGAGAVEVKFNNFTTLAQLSLEKYVSIFEAISWLSSMSNDDLENNIGIVTNQELLSLSSSDSVGRLVFSTFNLPSGIGVSFAFHLSGYEADEINLAKKNFFLLPDTYSLFYKQLNNLGKLTMARAKINAVVEHALKEGFKV